MQLLVSVASPAEARRAVDGGADLIDAKDPTTGALGAVPLDTLREIHSAVAGRRIVTAAIGDAGDERRVERAAFEYAAVGVGFVKVGFSGITSLPRIEQLIAVTVRGARTGSQARCGVVAVAYADTGGTTSVHAADLVRAAVNAGASGILLDTALKDGPGLLRLTTADALGAWVSRARHSRLTVAVAGKLSIGDLPLIRDLGADIAGVRGAACDGGRSGQVAAEKVRALKSTLAGATVI